MYERPLLVRPLQLNEITGEIVDSAFKVHSGLGPGLLESAYKTCLTHELRSRSLIVREEVPIPIFYDGVRIRTAFRIDQLVEEAVVVELKSVQTILPIHEAKLLSHLRLSKHRVGLLINFNVRYLRDGITRLIDGY
jgi:GxxExxY protein